MKKLLEEAQRVIRINSVTANGNEELANYLAGLMQDRGLKTQLQQVTHSLENVSKRQFNVIGILGDPLVDKKTRKGLLLNTHLDTVSPGLTENWTETGNNPFSANIKDGRLYGLGAADVKVDFLCKLRAIQKFREKKLKMPIYLVGTCGEELGMYGVRYLIKSMSLNPKFVIVGEPSDLKIVYAHKSLNVYKVSIGYQSIERDARGFNRRVDLHSFGWSAHGSYPHLGTNAILQALDFLQLAGDNGFEFRFTKIEGGDTVNKVPDRATVEFFLTSHQFEDFKRFFRETARANGQEKAFRVTLGGIGDMGVSFLPDAIFPCTAEIVSFFREVSSEFERVSDPAFDPAHSTINFGLVRPRLGGIDLYYDVRLLPDQSPGLVANRIQDGVQQVAARFPSLNINCTLERTNPGLNMTPKHELVTLCQEAMVNAGVEPSFSKKATSTEASQYFQAGYEAVVFGPGHSKGNSHSPNEYNMIDHLEKAVIFYEKLIERICL